MHKGHCYTCISIFNGKPLTFRSPSTEDPCMVCATSDHPLMLFPAKVSYFAQTISKCHMS